MSDTVLRQDSRTQSIAAAPTQPTGGQSATTYDGEVTANLGGGMYSVIRLAQGGGAARAHAAVLSYPLVTDLTVGAKVTLEYKPGVPIPRITTGSGGGGGGTTIVAGRFIGFPEGD